MDHHTALKLVPLWLACLKISGCAEFGPVNTKESDVLAPNVFSQLTITDHQHMKTSALKQRKVMYHCGSSYICMQSAHLKTSGCAEFGPVNTKESNVLAPNIFSQKWIIIQLWNLYHCNWHAWKPQGALSWPCKYKGKWCFSPKCVFLWNRSSYSFETCTIVIGMAENLRVCWVWPCKYKGKWCFSPKCVFSETDHHTALKLVPLQLALPENLRVHWGWPSKYKGRWCFSPKCVFS